MGKAEGREGARTFFRGQKFLAQCCEVGVLRRRDYVETRALSLTLPASTLTVYSISRPPLDFRSEVFCETKRSKSFSEGTPARSPVSVRASTSLSYSSCTLSFSFSGSENASAKRAARFVSAAASAVAACA